MFNAYIWKNYLRAGGEDVASLFEDNLKTAISEKYIKKIAEFRKIYCPDQRVIEYSCQQLRDIAKDIKNDVYLIESGSYTIPSAIEIFFENICVDCDGSEHDAFLLFSESIDYFSTFFAIELPDLFVPWHFKYNFNFFERIAQEFDIEVPQIPQKKDYKERVLYYGKICSSLFDFRKGHSLSPSELCAFLYDFAPNYLGGTSSYIINELPEPKSVFFIGGAPDDIFLTNDAAQVVCWQGNPDSLAGDLAVMYLRSPVSAVDSLWRIVSIGFNDPFFYYYRCVYIKIVQSIKRITLKELRQDDIFSKLPIVSKNMQGVNGVEIPPSAYNHLLDLSCSTLSRLKFFPKNNDTLQCEKDVENKLIKPFLEKLGYTREEYQQQLYIEIGNHSYALIPDFVVHPLFVHDHYSAWVMTSREDSL